MYKRTPITACSADYKCESLNHSSPPPAILRSACNTMESSVACLRRRRLLLPAFTMFLLLPLCLVVLARYYFVGLGLLNYVRLIASWMLCRLYKLSIMTLTFRSLIAQKIVSNTSRPLKTVELF